MKLCTSCNKSILVSYSSDFMLFYSLVSIHKLNIYFKNTNSLKIEMLTHCAQALRVVCLLYIKNDIHLILMCFFFLLFLIFRER